MVSRIIYAHEKSMREKKEILFVFLGRETSLLTSTPLFLLCVFCVFTQCFFAKTQLVTRVIG